MKDIALTMKIKKMITKEFATAFARDWIGEWNTHDLEKALPLYLNEFTIETP